MHGKSCLTHLRLYKLFNTSTAQTTCFVSTKLSKTTTFKAREEDFFTQLCSNGHVKEAFTRFNSEIWSNPSLFSHLLQTITLRKSIPTGKQLHCLIITSGCLNRFLSNQLLNMYAKLRKLRTAIVLFDHIPLRNTMSCNIMINAYIQCGDIERARNVFNEILERNVATWNAMISGLIHFELNEDGLELFCQMNELGFLADEFTLGSVLRGCAGLRGLCAGKQVHCCVVKRGFEMDLVIGSSLSHMYMKLGRVGDGERVIDSMPSRNVIAWNTLIAGKAQNGNSKEVLETYSVMKLAGFRPDKITFVSVIGACSELATLGKGWEIHGEAIKAGVCSVVSVITSLVSMYSKCGCLEDSVKAFGESDVVDAVLWSSMVSAYGIHGRGEEAIELFERMEQEGLIESNDVAFLSLLYACSHCGLKEKGIELFDLMVEKYGLKPRVEHYNCIVDLLGRSGCLEQAEAMIRSMPVKPDAVIWKTLLSACKIHKNAGMARRVAEEVLKLDPHDSALYVLLSNVHASAKRWNEVSEVRKAIRDKNLRHRQGMSWLEIKNQVHHFCMGDKSHPNLTEINQYLSELTKEMKLRGYVPETSLVLHDMDIEEKEQSLAYHSEKLAVAFALMNMPEGVPIRVMKNLRVCEDCHKAIKYISDIKKRKIVVRDTSRFHHFLNGICSCGDYW